MFDAVSDDIDHTTPGNLPLQSGEEFSACHSGCIIFTSQSKFLKLFRLRSFEEREKLLRINRIFTVIRR